MAEAHRYADGFRALRNQLVQAEAFAKQSSTDLLKRAREFHQFSNNEQFVLANELFGLSGSPGMRQVEIAGQFRFRRRAEVDELLKQAESLAERYFERLLWESLRTTTNSAEILIRQAVAENCPWIPKATWLAVKTNDIGRASICQALVADIIGEGAREPHSTALNVHEESNRFAQALGALIKNIEGECSGPTDGKSSAKSKPGRPKASEQERAEDERITTKFRGGNRRLTYAEFAKENDMTGDEVERIINRHDHRVKKKRRK